MLPIRHRASRRSFTLIELLAVIAAAAVLILVLLQNVWQARRSARVTGTLGNGRMIYTLLYAEDMDRFATGSNSVLPSSTVGPRYASSTEYFLKMKQHALRDLDYAIFAAPGIDPATGTVFTAANNAWKLTLDLTTNSPGTTPVLFTRNIDTPENRLKPGNDHELLRGEDPFGHSAAVVVMWWGSTLRLSRDTMNLFNPTGASNAVLVP